MKACGLLLLGLLACGDGPGDSAPSDSGSPPAPDRCATSLDGSGGSALGVVACDGGRCRVPAGSFWMGSADPARPDACPAHLVRLSTYFIDQTEVTVGAWAACVEAGSCPPLPGRCESEAPADEPDALPATCISHDEAAAYCAWAGGRLPTEAEWERAIRGDDGARYAWGAVSPTCSRANFRFASSYCELGPVPVGRYPEGASPFGLLDGAGNVWEWVADAYDAQAYDDAPAQDPGSPETCREAVGSPAGTCRLRVIRGGAWNGSESTLRATERGAAEPSVRDDNIGLRCAYDD